MTAKEFWKQKFDEYPQNDAEKLAVVMMQEYSQYILTDKDKEITTEEAAKEYLVEFIEENFYTKGQCMNEEQMSIKEIIKYYYNPPVSNKYKNIEQAARDKAQELHDIRENRDGYSNPVYYEGAQDGFLACAFNKDAVEDEAPKRNDDTLYTYYEINFKDWPEEFDYTICETLDEVRKYLQMADIHFDDDTRSTEVIVKGIAMTHMAYKEWCKENGLMTDPDHHKDYNYE